MDVAIFGVPFDAGTSCRPGASHSSAIIRAIWQGLIDPRRSIQVGIRGSLPYANDLDRTRPRGLTIVTVEELCQRGIHDVAAQALNLVGEGVYFTFDY